jgi:hypothetical protein
MPENQNIDYKFLIRNISFEESVGTYYEIEKAGKAGKKRAKRVQSGQLQCKKRAITMQKECYVNYKMDDHYAAKCNASC